MELLFPQRGYILMITVTVKAETTSRFVRKIMVANKAVHAAVVDVGEGYRQQRRLGSKRGLPVRQPKHQYYRQYQTKEDDSPGFHGCFSPP